VAFGARWQPGFHVDDRQAAQTPWGPQPARRIHCFGDAAERLSLTKRFVSRARLKLTQCRRLTLEQKKNNVPLMFHKERAMIRTFVEEAAALASIVLFVGMIAVWAQLIPQF
jgi:hypothetical protein